MSLVTRFLDPALVERLNQLQLSARRVVEGTTAGRHRSALKGASVEFRQHRAYVAGDEPRRLDWRILARTDRPYVKQYDEETNLRCAIVLDRSGSMRYRGAGSTASKFDYAAHLVASLAYLMLAQTESVGLAIAGARLEQWIAPHAGTKQLSRLLDVLERTSPANAGAPARAVADIADRIGRRSQVIVVSDFFSPLEAWREALARLRHDRHELLLLQINDRDELTFPFDGPSRFHGLEGEIPQLAEPALVRKTYLANLEQHGTELHELCHKLHVELARFVTHVPLLDALTTFLRRRG